MSTKEELEKALLAANARNDELQSTLTAIEQRVQGLESAPRIAPVAPVSRRALQRAKGAQVINVDFRGDRYEVITCLTVEQADALRGRWPDGVVQLERIGETELLTSQAARSWLVRTVCRLAGVEHEWEKVDAKAAGRSKPYERRRLPKGAGGNLLELSQRFAQPMAQSARPGLKTRLTRVERTRAVQPAQRRAER